MTLLLVLDEAVRYFEEGSAERAFAARRAYRGRDAVVENVLEAVRESLRLDSRPRHAAAIASLVREGYRELRAGRFLEAKKLAAAAERLRREAAREHLDDQNVPAGLAAKAVTDLLSEAAEALQRAADSEAEKA